MGGILKALRSHIPLLRPTSFWALIVLQLVALESPTPSPNRLSLGFPPLKHHNHVL
jgi:hypothetical protein